MKWAENAGRTVGKVARQGAPLAGLIPGVGTLYGATIGGLGSVLEGRNMKGHLSSAGQGALSGFANTQFLGGQGFKGIPGAFGGGGSPLAEANAAGNSANFGAANATADVGAGVPGMNAMNPLHTAMASGSPSPASGGLLSKLGGVADWAEAHPTAAAGALQGAGEFMGNGSEDRLNDAQSLSLEQRNEETEYDFQQRKRREELMKPLWSVLGSGFSNTGGTTAPNPYSGGR